MTEQEQKKQLKNLEKYLGKVAEAERKDLDYLLNNAYSEQHRIVKSMNMILNLIIAANITSFLYLSEKHFFHLHKIDSWIGITCSIILSLAFLGSFFYAVWGAYSSIEFIQSEKARSRHFPQMEIVEMAGAEKDDFCVKKLFALITNQREAIKKNRENIEERQGTIVKLKDRTSYAFILFIMFLTFSGCIILGKEWSLNMAQDKNETTGSQTTLTDTLSATDQLQKDLEALAYKANSYALSDKLSLESDISSQAKTDQLFLENTNEKDD